MAGSPARDTHIGTLDGFDVLETTTEWDHYGVRYDLRLAGVPGEPISLTGDELAASDGHGLVIRLENRLRGLEATQTTALAEAAQLRREAAAASRLGTPFDQEETAAGPCDAGRPRSSRPCYPIRRRPPTRLGSSQAASPASSPTSTPGQGQPSPLPSPPSNDIFEVGAQT